MKTTTLLLLFLLSFATGFTQGENSIITNNELINEYIQSYVDETNKRGLDIKDVLLKKIDYILIATDDIKVTQLSETHLGDKLIVLDNVVLLDRLIMKATVYRELSYTLGIQYNNGSVIMNKDRKVGFSYALYDDVEIMEIEMDKISTKLLRL